MASDLTQRKLLSVPKLTFKAAVEQALAMETADKELTVNTVTKLKGHMEDSEEETTNYIKEVYYCKSRQDKLDQGPVTIKLLVQDKRVSFEVDTGASSTIIPKQVFRELFPNVKLFKKGHKVKLFFGKYPDKVYEAYVDVKLGNKLMKLRAFVPSSGEDIGLLGRSWLNIIMPGWKSQFEVKREPRMLQSQINVLSKSSQYPSNANQLNKIIVNEIPLSHKDIAYFTNKDKILGTVKQYVQNGWPRSIQDDSKHYFSMREDINIDLGCLTFKNRVIIPNTLKEEVLQLLHEGHPGVVKIKGLARNYVYWQGINKDIENKVKSCECCQINSNQVQTPVFSWKRTNKKWQRLHIDFAEKYNYKFLLLVDAHSKNLLHPLTELTPAELKLKFKPRTRLTILKLNPNKKIEKKQFKYISNRNHKFTDQQYKLFEVGEQ
ncbi:hypothetical protein ILUMI_05573, partial [Ignelater luminosus]